jgi:RNA polymerase sigma-70 factor (ECF subfamily)
MEKDLSKLILNLVNYAQKFVRNNDVAHDLVQDALFKAISKGKLQQVGWIKTVIKHAAYRIDKGKTCVLNFDLEDEEFIEEESIVDYMYNLDSKSKNLLFQRYFQQFSIRQISELLNKPEGTIKRNLFEARESLKREIDMSEKLVAPEISIFPKEQLTKRELKITGQSLLMGNPAMEIGDTELINYYQYPGRILSYQSETSVLRKLDLFGKEVVEIVNKYQKRVGETQRRMYYHVTDDELEMVMRIFEWDKEGIEVQTDKKELVQPCSRTLKTGTSITDIQTEIVDIIDLKIGETLYPDCFRARFSSNDYHGKEYVEEYYSKDGRPILNRCFIGDNWKMGGYVTWESMEKSLEIEFENEKYRLWTETVLMKSFRKD